MAQPAPFFDLLPEADQTAVRTALGRCTYLRCDSTLDSIAEDILRSRARLAAAEFAARTARKEAR